MAELFRRHPRIARWGALAAILVAGLAVRLIALWVTGAERVPILDEKLYLMRAESLLNGEGFVGSYQSWVRHPYTPFLAALPQYSGAYQPPLYTVFVAFCLRLFAHHAIGVLLVQVALSTATVGVVFGLGRSWFGRRVGLVAAGICAFYPNLVAFSHFYWSETLFTFLLVGAVWTLTRRQELPAPKAAAAAGVVFGLAVLTRSSLAWFLPVLVVWMLVSHRDRRRDAAARAAVLLLAAACVIAPWSVRNTRLHGGFVLVETGNAFNLWRGNNPDTFRERPATPDRSYAPPFRALPLMPVGEQNTLVFVRRVMDELGDERPTDLEIARTGRRLAWGYVLREPAAFVRRAATKIVDMWNPTSYLLRQLRLGAYGDVRPAVEIVVSWCAVVSYLLAMIFGVWGLILGRRNRHVQLIALLVGFHTAIHATAFGLTRFRLPLMPFLIVAAAFALNELYARRRPRASTAAIPGR